MNPSALFTSFYTIVRKDVVRIFRIWPQTLLPSVITSALYFLIFGAFLGERIGVIAGVPYINFVIPGLVMLAVVTNSYSNVAMTFFSSKFFARSIDELLVSPTPPWVVIAGFVAGGIVRGILVGLLVLVTSVLFANPTVHNIPIIVLFLLLTSLVFSLAGLVNGIYAKSMDGISIVPTFVLTPLVYLGGVFYTVAALPQFWQTFTILNPIFYLVNGFRFGFLGVADVSLWISVAVLLALAAVLIGVAWYLIRTGLGLKQ